MVVLRHLNPEYGLPLNALIKYPKTKAQPDFQKNPAEVLAASPREAKNSPEIKIPLPFSAATGRSWPRPLRGAPLIHPSRGWSLIAVIDAATGSKY
jgi:hypothetical protein